MPRISAEGGASHATAAGVTVFESNTQLVCADGVARDVSELGIATTAGVASSIATQAAADSATYVRTVNGTGPDGSGNVAVVGGNGRIKPLEGASFFTYGHSYNATATNTQLFHARIASRNGTTAVTQRGVNGYSMADTLAAIRSNWVPNTRGLVTLISVQNDVNGSLGSATTAEAFRSCLAHLTASAVLAQNDSAFAYSAGWTSGSTTTNGSYVDFGWNGDAAYVLMDYVTGSGSTVTITRSGDGATVATVTTGGYGASFTGAVKLSGFGAGSHTVRITLTSGGVLQFRGAAIPADTPPAVVWIPDPPVLGYGPTKAAQITTYDTACAVVAATFPTVLVTSMSGWDNATMVAADNIHPNDKGHSYIADQVEAALANHGFSQGLSYQALSTAGTAYTGTTPSYSVNGVPSQVGTVTVTPGDGQLALSWSAPAANGFAITDYVVQYRTPNGSGGWTTFAHAPSSATTLTITGLTNGSAYGVQVAAVNSAGTGAFSAEATGTPSAAATVPGAPTSLSATSGNASASLTWTAPASNGGASITDYVVQYRTTAGPGSWNTFADGTSTTTTATVTGLTNGTSYDFQVAAVNSVGTGSYSSTATATPAVGATVSDAFNRADTVTGLGTSDTGQAWSATSNFRILSNKAQGISATDNTAVINAGVSDTTVQATLATPGDTGLVARWSDNSNFWMAWASASTSKWGLMKKASNSYSQVGSSSAGNASANDVVQLVCSGNTVTLKVNGVTIASDSTGFNSTATSHGLRQASGGQGAGVWDDFTVL